MSARCDSQPEDLLRRDDVDAQCKSARRQTSRLSQALRGIQEWLFRPQAVAASRLERPSSTNRSPGDVAAAPWSRHGLPLALEIAECLIPHVVARAADVLLIQAGLPPQSIKVSHAGVRELSFAPVPL